ncbi:MAG: hypothetical protein AAGC47_07075 [Bacteroidota bacterium]
MISKSMLTKGVNVFLFLLICHSSFSQIGTWRDYLNYNNALHVDVLGNEIYVASENGLFIHNRSSNDVTRLSKVNGLSDIGITAIAANQETNLVMIGYENGNIDLIRDRTITNFIDIKTSSVIGDKTIRHIYFQGINAYISTGLGIIVFDTERVEVRDTYELLPTGSPSINEVTVLNDTLFAATEEGLYSGALSSDLTIFDNWSLDFSIPEPFQDLENVSSVGGLLYVNYRNGQNPGVYRRDSENWNRINSGGDIEELKESDFGLIVNTSYFIDAKNLDGSSNYIIDEYSGVNENLRVSEAIFDELGNMWIADSRLGLVKYTSDEEFEFINVEGPGNNSVFKLEFSDGRLWVASGFPQHPGNWNNNFRRIGFYKFYEGRWDNYLPADLPIISEEELNDITVVYPDPKNPDRAYVGSWFGGLAVAEALDIPMVFDENNSGLQVREEFDRPEGEGFVAVSDVEADQDGDLWMTNGYADEPLVVKRADGSWESFALNSSYDGTDVLIRLIVSQDGNIWMLHNREGVVAYNPALDSTVTFTAQNGGIHIDEVFSIAEDLDGEIWVGSADGVSVFFSPFDAFSGRPSDARQILVEQGGIFQFLLEDQRVSAIAVDGANRKWIGTFESGVFLLSEDGTEQILRFTAEDSPLFADRILDIAINDETGEVFIATLEGIVSYQGDALSGEITNECISVYPNPVRETYSGPISIEGVMRDSEVKITDMRGNLIKELQSNGGLAVWDGKNLNGERVATGVYFALVSNEAADSDCVSKVLVIK